MKALYCVDYLSHRWDSDDLACSYREIRKKLLDINHKTFLNDSYEDVRWRGRRRGSIRNKEQHDAHTEEYRLKRLENALWRSMARKDSQLLDPEKINWQKTNDITWLYGPFHQSNPKHTNCSPAISSLNTSPVTSPVREYSAPPFLKPALKKRDELEHDLDKLESLWGLDPAIISKAPQNTEPIAYHGRRRKTWPNTSFDKKSLRFNPNVMQVEYTPSSPVVRLVAANKDSQGQSRQKYDIPSTSQKSVKQTTGRLRTSSQSAPWMPPSPPPSPPLGAEEAWRKCDYYFEPPRKPETQDENSVLTLTTQVASNVRDIAVLCGAIVVYKGISLTVSPLAWMADRIVGN